MRHSATPRRRSLLLPIVLILAGLYLLAPQLGVRLPNVLPLLVRFWPLLLIVLGLELLLSRRRSGLGLLLGLLLSAALIGGLYASGKVTLNDELVRSPIDQPLESIKRAEVQLDVGAAELSLAALPQESGKLAEGSLESNYLQLEQSYSAQGESGRLTLATAGSSFFLVNGQARWDLRLSRRLPLSLTLNAGASRFAIDLAGLQLEQLELDCGASEGSVTLPSQGQPRLHIHAGASTLTIVVPPQVGAHITINSSASKVTADPARFSQQGNIYSTSSSDGESQLELVVDGGAASITIR